VQDLALSLIEPHEVYTGPPLQLVQVSLDDILSLRCVSCTGVSACFHLQTCWGCTWSRCLCHWWKY